MIDACIGKKGRGIPRKASRKVTPDNQPGIVEEEGRETFGGDLGELPEYEGKYDSEEKRLKDEPSGTEDGLFVLSEEVATNQKVKEVAVLPNAGEIEPRPTLRGLNEGNLFVR